MKKIKRPAPVIEALEPRILFSADLFGGAIDTPIADDPLATLLDDTAIVLEQQRLATPDQNDEDSVPLTGAADGEGTRAQIPELLFVDSRTPDYQQLIDDLATNESRQFEVILIDAQDSGLQVISDTLSAYQNVAAIHLISHGSAGEVTLGTDILDANTLNDQSDTFASWSEALTEDADLLIYGCDLASTAEGERLVDSLAQLTGADVAASDDLTGSAALGGDWDLERQTGIIDTAVAFSEELQRDWTGTLDAEQLTADYLTTPLSFEQNAGQTDAAVDFLARGSGYTVFLSEADAVISLAVGEQSYVLRLDMVGADPGAPASGESLLASTSNYLTGDDSSSWQTGVDNYGAVRYDNVYEGIDLRYYGNQRELEYDFIVDAGADTSQIKINFDGAQSVEIAESGELLISFNEEGDHIRFKAPVSYQTAEDGSRISVDSRYILNDDGSIGFELGEYDATKTLIIDPILDYGAYLGGTGFDAANGIAVDAAGNAYITGYTISTDFPTTTGAYNESSNGAYDIFVSKLSADGSSLVYSTFIGGSGNDYGNAITVDSSGNVYVTGNTESSDFAVVGGYQSSLSGASDAVLLKLNAAGDTIAYSTYFGGNGQQDEGYGVALDSNDDVYIAGMTRSSDLPLLNANDSTLDGNDDGFIAKFDLTQTGASSLLYSTYFGGNDQDQINDIDVDSSGNIYVVGATKSTDLPTTVNAYQSSNGGAWDAFVAKFNAADMSLLYSTYIGGGGGESGNALAVDDAGNAYVAGDGDNDASVWKIDTTQSGAASMIYSTSFGGNKADVVVDIAIDATGRAYLAGYTLSTNFPTAGGPLDSARSGSQDGFLTILDATGSSLEYSTYIGAGGSDHAKGVALDSQNNIYVVGQAASQFFDNVTATSFGAGGSDDAFILKFSSLGGVSPVSDTDGTADAVNEDASIGASVGVTANAIDPIGGDTVTYSLDDDAGGLFSIDATTGVVTLAAGLDAETATSHNITLRATSSDASFSTKTLSIAVNDVDEFDVGAVTDADAGANSLAEDASDGATVGVTGLATDADVTDNVTYSLTDNAGGRFAINASTGVVTVLDSSLLDYETATSHAIKITSTSSDGSLTAKSFTINLSDVNESVGAVSDTDAGADAVDENALIGDTVGVTANATDPDGGDTLSYSLDDSAGGLFSIDATSGVVTLDAGLDAETATSHSVTIRAISSDTSFSTTTLSIAVNDVDEFDVGAVTDSNVAANSVAEHASVGIGVGVTGLATDADVTDNLTYSLSDDAGGRFAIDANSGVITVNGALDYETNTSHSVTVLATSDDSSTASQSFTIDVTDVNESAGAVSDTDATDDAVDENDQESDAVDGSEEETVVEELTEANGTDSEGTEAGAEAESALAAMVGETMAVQPVDGAVLASVVADVQPDQDSYQGVATKPIPPKSINLLNLDIAPFEPVGQEPGQMRSLMENDSFVEGLEAMNHDLDKAMEDGTAHYRLGAETAIGVTISLSAGFVSWVLRTGSLLASFMSVVPLWKQLDPLPILGAEMAEKCKDQAQQKNAEDEEDEKVEALFK